MDIKLPELGENIESGTITNILVNVGDTVTKDQSVLELETDKAVVEVPSPAAGTVKEILVKDGDDVSVGQPIFVFDSSAPSSDAPTPKQETTKEETKQKTEDPKPAESATPTTPTPTSTTTSSFSPKPNAAIPAQRNVNAAPSVRRFARELGVDLSYVPGSGPGGRISVEDVKSYIKGVFQSGGPVAAAPAKKTKPLPDFSKYGSVRSEKMSKIRQVTAEHMDFCWSTIPHVTQFDKADSTVINDLRKKMTTSDRKVTITPLLLKIMAAALKEFPQFNASIDIENKQIIYREYFHIGVAVDTPRGLVVPKVRDVDQKDTLAITDELNEMAGRARDGKTGLDELQGGSMTLTNLGGIGGHAFTPIVNWPEVCILGVSRGSKEAIWNGESFEPKMMLPLSLSYDHRIIDGADAARFLRWICTAIEDPSIVGLK